MFNSAWYYSLTRPPLTPPAWVFAPAWTILYILIFVALLLFSIKHSDESKSWGYLLFFCQLALNFCWSPAFFLLHNIGFAFALVILMDILTIMTIIEFYKVSKSAGICLIPYFLWILFATYLNIGYLVLN